MKTEKYCKRCDSTKPVSEFTPSAGRYDGLQTYCRECMRIYRREHYRSNPQPYKDRAKELKRKIAEHLKEHKSVPCMDCNVQYPSYVMDLDHREEHDKVVDVSKMVSLGNWSKYLAELKKCDVVCSNCHRERTHQRRLDRSSSEVV